MVTGSSSTLPENRCHEKRRGQGAASGAERGRDDEDRPRWNVYSATKAAVRSFARTWTENLKDRRIHVNAVSPGVIDMPAWQVSVASEHRLKIAPNGIPLARTWTSEEIATAVVFLASEDSSYITGPELFVDGGIAQV
jgi:NAD(P)-dependent dehydrogenase (short-subunit alcohol dehydrogenase family)